MGTYTHTFHRCDGDYCGAEMDCSGYNSREVLDELITNDGWTKVGNKLYCWRHSMERALFALPEAPFYGIVEVRTDGEHLMVYKNWRDYCMVNIDAYFGNWRTQTRRARINDYHWEQPTDPIQVKVVALFSDPEVE